MGNVSKAIAASLGGGVGGLGASALVLPEGSPWWAYLLLTLVPSILSTLTTYAAPKNSG